MVQITKKEAPVFEIHTLCNPPTASAKAPIQAKSWSNGKIPPYLPHHRETKTTSNNPKLASTGDQGTFITPKLKASK
jgi:hypothetical protein